MNTKTVASSEQRVASSEPAAWYSRAAARACAWVIGAVLGMLWLGIAAGYCVVAAVKFCALPGSAWKMLREMEGERK